MPVELPRSVAELDRHSQEHARLVIEQGILPEEEIRRPLLELLAHTIEACGSKPAAWTIKLAPLEVVINAGWARILRLRREWMDLSFDEGALSDEARRWLEEHRVAEPTEPVQSGNREVRVPTEAASRAVGLLGGIAASAVAREYAKKTGRILWWEANSPGVVAYLESVLGRDLPYPDYTAKRPGVRYWKISPGAQAWQWGECRENGFIGIGWPRLGDLRRFDSREQFESAREEIEREDEAYSKVACGQVWQFLHIREGDRIVANRGTREIVGVGTVAGGYEHVPGDEQHPHHLSVRWDRTDPIAVDQQGWKRTLIELGRATFDRLTSGPEEAEVQDETPAGAFDAIAGSLRGSGYYFSDEVLAAFLLALQAKRFVILTGISGTGKTRLALEVARHFSGTRTERVSVDVPETAIEVTVSPYMVNRRRTVIPMELLSTLELPALGEQNSAPLAVAFPGGVESMRLWKSPETGVAVLGLSGEVGKWFREHLSPGDTFVLEAPQEEEGPYFRLSLPQKLEREVAVQAVEVVAVRPDWTDNRSLLGFFNPLTEQYVTTPFLDLLLRAGDEEDRAMTEDREPLPFFAILDEMNLARVEQYFSDFLSAIESGEPVHLHDSEEVEEGRSPGRVVPRRLVVPGNLFLVGTVNVDESTYMFSPKVLDRAFTMELDEVDLLAMGGLEPGEAPSALALSGLPARPRAGSRPGPEDWTRLCDDHRDVAEAIHAINELLMGEHRHFGYRVANEIARYVLLAHEQAGEEARDVAFDLAILQKVLPKLSGTQQELQPTLDALFAFAILGAAPSDRDVDTLRSDSDWVVERGGRLARPGQEAEPEGGLAADDEVPSRVTLPAYPRTAAKLFRMRRRLRQQGFAAFIE
jgi:hypothetical protein